MILVQNYTLAVLMCVLAMICWGSWQNTQNLAGKSWRFELFYWDFILGILLFSLVMAFTFGSMGTSGRDFISDLKQASAGNLLSAALGGAIWNLGTLLLVAAISIAGMSVAFPIGGGIGWILGIFINYAGSPEGNPWFSVWRITCHRIGHFVQHDRIQAAGPDTEKGPLQGNYIILCCRSADRFLLPLCCFGDGYGIYFLPPPARSLHTLPWLFFLSGP